MFMHSNPMESRGIMSWRQFSLFLVVVALRSWLPTGFRAGEGLAGFFIHLFNHHVVFLVGNAIIVLLFVTFSGNYDFEEDMNTARNGFDGYWENCGKLDTLYPSTSAADAGEIRQIVLGPSENDISKCDDVTTTAIEEARKQIDKLQRTQKGKRLKRKMAVRRPPEVDKHRCTAADIENLSSEDFRRTVDAFIGEHWSNNKWKYGNQTSLVN